MSQQIDSYKSLLNQCVDQYFKHKAGYLLNEVFVDSLDPDMVKTEQHEPGFLVDLFDSCIPSSAKREFKALVSGDDYTELNELLNSISLDDPTLASFHRDTMAGGFNTTSALDELEIKRITFARMFISVAKRKFGKALTDLHSSGNKKHDPDSMSDSEKATREIFELVEQKHGKYMGLRRLSSYCSLSTSQRVDIATQIDDIESTPHFTQEFRGTCKKFAAWLSSYE